MTRQVDMSPAAVDARLTRCSELSTLDFAPLARIDMSPPAVEARLLECAEMSELCLELGRASAR